MLLEADQYSGTVRFKAAQSLFQRDVLLEDKNQDDLQKSKLKKFLEKEGMDVDARIRERKFGAQSILETETEAIMTLFALQTTSAVLASVEIENTLDKFNVDGFPSIKLLKDGDQPSQAIDYDAKPQIDSLNQFVFVPLTPFAYIHSL